jgi:hypothetical protein
MVNFSTSYTENLLACCEKNGLFPNITGGGKYILFIYVYPLYSGFSVTVIVFPAVVIGSL